jgi:hypothetical protein
MMIAVVAVIMAASYFVGAISQAAKEEAKRDPRERDSSGCIVIMGWLGMAAGFLTFAWAYA